MTCFCFNFSPEKVVYNVSVLPHNKYCDQKNCGNFKDKIVILILPQMTLKLKFVHQTVEPDPFKIKFRFRFGFSNFFFYGFSSGSGSANFIFRGSVPVQVQQILFFRVQKIITVNTGLRIRFGSGSGPVRHLDKNCIYILQLTKWIPSLVCV